MSDLVDIVLGESFKVYYSTGTWYIGKGNRQNKNKYHTKQW